MHRRDMKNILVVIGHPYWEKSVANKQIVEALKATGQNITFSNITELYPDCKLTVDAEQRKLLDADVIVFQFPIMWYGAPSIMHKYFEEVLTYGFAYGPGGDKLKGKPLIASCTAGAPENAYSRTGIQGYTMDELMPPLTATIVYCNMKWDGYVCSYGMMHPTSTTIDNHVSRLLDKINSL